MPTGSKLIGGLAFAALAYFISGLVIPLLPEGTQVGKFGPINAFVGFVMGWTLMGKGAGNTYRQAFGYGLTTLFATLFWCLLVWSGHLMLKNSLRLRYDGAVEALQDMAQIFIEFAMLISVREVMIPAIVGALFLSWVAEFFARRWS